MLIELPRTLRYPNDMMRYSSIELLSRVMRIAVIKRVKRMLLIAMKAIAMFKTCFLAGLISAKYSGDKAVRSCGESDRAASSCGESEVIVDNKNHAGFVVVVSWKGKY